ncbi:VCBS repeat-containing protein [Streptomyces sp. TX20-6-3]|uniref:FG-GAP repeat domain-containing protein n=1 Tax=Streptomyces sp. TX20-6-3 TaxID=3028705 RepID=UPI0029BC758E|nr:VCBS repeat-containing protein [Streptomyces sp. TX20-6-3]MDX2564540.1 VCBS repeat-containing protein [Streptomyces sp. TX20-6-3]
MNQAARRIGALSAATGLLTVATLANSGTAMAEDNLPRLSAHDQVAAPGSAPRLSPEVQAGAADGKTVIAFSTKPLTGPAGDGAGVPKGFTAQANDCTEAAGLVAVYVCGPSGLRPGFVVPADAPDMATVHWGFAYVPKGGDLAAAIETARTAGAIPAGATHGSAKVVVKTAAHAALNTVAFDLPDVPSGATVRQQLRVHANEAGKLTLRFRPADGYLWRQPDDIHIGGLTTGPGATCAQPSTTLLSTMANLDCDLEPGDHTIGYELTTPSGAYTLNLVALTTYDIYDFGTWSSYVRRTSAPFTAPGKAVFPRHGLLARDTTGTLFEYQGTGTATSALTPRDQVGTGWQTYNTLTELSPLKEFPAHFGYVLPSAATRGHGDLVVRDASGTLWYYDRQDVDTRPFAPRVKVGTGWNVYDRIDGAGDLDRDSYMDLLARDKAGVLWLYMGTGSFTGARFKTRVKVGSGWGTYNQLAGGADVTGDGRADLLARDKTGVLWLYRGTGSRTAPYATRTKIGAGWNSYNQLLIAGDLTDDGKTDAVARDTAGILWLYQGTNNAAAPFATRTRIGSGWNSYNRIL